MKIAYLTMAGVLLATIGAARQMQPQPAVPQTTPAPVSSTMPGTPAQPPPAQPAQGAPTQGGPSGGTVKLNSVDKKGPSGSAVLAQQGSNVTITVQVPTDATTAAVFSGTCTPSGKPQQNGPAMPLKPVVNHSSQTVIPNTTVASLTTSPHAIIVQGGNASPLCGDVSTLTAAPAGAPPKP